MKLAGYIRVSTDKQLNDGLGKETQIDSIEKWAVLHNHEIVEWYCDDAISGTISGNDRPAMHQLISDASDGLVEGIVAYDASRYARDFFVQESLFGILWSHNLTIYCVGGGEVQKDDANDPTRKMIRQIIGVVAQFERDQMYMRLHTGRRRKMAEGGWGGGTPPYGYKTEGKGKSSVLVEDQKEQQVIQVIHNLAADGMSHEKIAEWLNANTFFTKTGKAWRQTQVSRIINKEK